MGEAKRKPDWVDAIVEFILRERMRGNEFPRTIAILKELAARDAARSSSVKLL